MCDLCRDQGIKGHNNTLPWVRVRNSLIFGLYLDFIVQCVRRRPTVGNTIPFQCSFPECYKKPATRGSSCPQVIQSSDKLQLSDNGEYVRTLQAPELWPIKVR